MELTANAQDCINLCLLCKNLLNWRCSRNANQQFWALFKYSLKNHWRIFFHQFCVNQCMNCKHIGALLHVWDTFLFWQIFQKSLVLYQLHINSRMASVNWLFWTLSQQLQRHFHHLASKVLLFLQWIVGKIDNVEHVTHWIDISQKCSIEWWDRIDIEKRIVMFIAILKCLIVWD